MEPRDVTWFHCREGCEGYILALHCRDESIHDFQQAKQSCISILKVAKANDCALPEVKAIKKAAGLDLENCYGVQARGFKAAGFGSKKIRYTRAAFLALAVTAALRAGENSVKSGGCLHKIAQMVISSAEHCYSLQGVFRMEWNLIRRFRELSSMQAWLKPRTKKVQVKRMPRPASAPSVPFYRLSENVKAKTMPRPTAAKAKVQDWRRQKCKEEEGPFGAQAKALPAPKGKKACPSEKRPRPEERVEEAMKAWEQANARVEALRAQAAERQDCPVLQAALAMSLKDQSAAYDHFQRQLSKSTEPPVKKVKEELDDGEDSRSEAASDCPSLKLKRRVRLGGVAISGSSRRGSFLWKIVQAARRRLKKSIKEEGNSDDEPDNGRSESYVRKPRQVFILRRAQQDVKEWDPGAAYADVDQVLESWVHLLELRDARTLLWAHERISSCFRHGEHQGRPVASLVADLRNGLDSMDIMPLVGVEDERGTWVISGNRRLHALRTWALECEGEVLVRILVHKHGKDIPQSLFAKYVEASTSRTGGWPEVGGACGWQRSTASAKASPAAVQDQGPALPATFPQLQGRWEGNDATYVVFPFGCEWRCLRSKAGTVKCFSLSYRAGDVTWGFGRFKARLLDSKLLWLDEIGQIAFEWHR
ncbi:unnamed protein product [Effrenium voratum]|uniref:ParB/Sulfiredoxin domain-containing protein n=1 Tax=Effrenium voratum TaxID=2562239 RepID=A0AA36MQU1_9DINO|nr:unnamed protein product [Effrenium voratum]CAJ1417790.1 unnamed protein product [Effrenium voratum]